MNPPRKRDSDVLENVADPPPYQGVQPNLVSPPLAKLKVSFLKINT